MLLADGLFVRSGLFYLLPDVSLKPLEELFRARVITFLLDEGLLRRSVPGCCVAGCIRVSMSNGNAVAVIDVSEHAPCRIPSAKWRELIKEVWEADPLLCPKCSRAMCIVALIDDREVIERILRHLGLWEQGMRVFPARAPPKPDERIVEPCYDDPFACLPVKI